MCECLGLWIGEWPNSGKALCVLRCIEKRSTSIRPFTEYKNLSDQVVIYHILSGSVGLLSSSTQFKMVLGPPQSTTSQYNPPNNLFPSQLSFKGTMKHIRRITLGPLRSIYCATPKPQRACWSRKNNNSSTGQSESQYSYATNIYEVVLQSWSCQKRTHASRRHRATCASDFSPFAAFSSRHLSNANPISTRALLRDLSLWVKHAHFSILSWARLLKPTRPWVSFWTAAIFH